MEQQHIDNSQLDVDSIIEDVEKEILFGSGEDEDLVSDKSDKEKHFNQIKRQFLKEHKSITKFKEKEIKQVVETYLKNLHQNRLNYVIFNTFQYWKEPYLLFVSHADRELFKLYNNLLTFKYVKIKKPKDWFILSHIFSLFSIIMYNQYEIKPIFINISALTKYLKSIDYNLKYIEYDSHTRYDFQTVYLPFKLVSQAKTNYTMVSFLIKDPFLLYFINYINRFMINVVCGQSKKYKKITIPITPEFIQQHSSSNKKTIIIPFKEVKKIINDTFNISIKPINFVFLLNKDIHNDKFLEKQLKKEENIISELMLISKFNKRDKTISILPVYKFENSKYESYTFRPYVKYIQEVKINAKEK